MYIFNNIAYCFISLKVCLDDMIKNFFCDIINLE